MGLRCLRARAFHGLCFLAWHGEVHDRFVAIRMPGGTDENEVRADREG